MTDKKNKSTGKKNVKVLKEPKIQKMFLKLPGVSSHATVCEIEFSETTNYFKPNMTLKTTKNIHKYEQL